MPNTGSEWSNPKYFVVFKLQLGELLVVRIVTDTSVRKLP